MTAWALKTFGGFRLFSRQGDEVNALGRRDRALLTYLALCPGQRENRDRLATLLWSNRQDEQARHSLVQSTAVIRKALGDVEKSVILSDVDALALDATFFDVDALAFQKLVSDGGRDALRQAVTLYAGDLLPGFETRSEGFDQWVDGERNRLRNLAIEALARLTSLHAEAGDWKATIDMANRVLDLDNLREDAHRALMLGYVSTSRRSLALQQYNLIADALERELKVEPERETTELFESIRKGVPVTPENTPHVLAGTSPTQPTTEQVPAVPDQTPSQAAIPVIQIEQRSHKWGLWVAGGIAISLLTAVVVVAATYWRIPELAPAPVGAIVQNIKEAIAPNPLSIAILPFESHGDPDAGAFADALSEGVTAALSMSSEMIVISRSSVLGYGDRPGAAQDLAHDLNVRYVLEGGVRKWGNQIAIDIGLIDALKGNHRVWTESYHRQSDDLISLQQDITLEVITSLEIRLTEGEQERINRAHGTGNLEAWLAAAQGEKHLRQLNERDLAIARAYYERASKLDPEYPGAWDGLGWTYFISARFGWMGSPEELIRQAKEIAERALALDPGRPRTYSLLGSISLLTGDFSHAVSFGEKAVSLGPNDADAAALLAHTLTYTGEPQRALTLIDRAIRLRPQPPRWYYWLLGRANRLAGHPERAVQILSAEISVELQSFIPLVELAAAYSDTDKLALAREISSRIVQKFPEFSIRSWIAMPPYEDPATMDREVAALRSAGLPE